MDKEQLLRLIWEDFEVITVYLQDHPIDSKEIFILAVCAARHAFELAPELREANNAIPK